MLRAFRSRQDDQGKSQPPPNFPAHSMAPDNGNEDSIEFVPPPPPSAASRGKNNRKLKSSHSSASSSPKRKTRSRLGMRFFRSKGSLEEVSWRDADGKNPSPALGSRRKSKSAVSASAGSQKSERGRPPRQRFSLRRLFFGNPMVAQPLYQSPAASTSTQKRAYQLAASGPKRNHDTQSIGAKSTGWRDNMSSCSSLQGAAALSVGGGGSGPGTSVEGLRPCPLCLSECTFDQFPLLRNCQHLFCVNCLQYYVRIEIQEGRANLHCPQCTETMHPNDVESLIGDKNSNLMTLYESLMLRRLLSTDPDTRWCPGPNCTYAVIAAGCASCPKITCERPGCGYSFCYHCKAEWHPNQTCDAARAERTTASSGLPLASRSQSATYGLELAASAAANVVTGGNFSLSQMGASEVKHCPRCETLIVKMDDGSCNHMTCALCYTEFCWLCMKEISDLHYLSPSGCTFWGKKPWSQKKKLLWQLGTLVGAPVGIAMLAGIAIPAMVIGIPCWVGKKIHNHLKDANKHKRNLAIVGGVVSSMAVSPLLAGMAVSIGVPILLCYVYGIVPIALCRSVGCGIYSSVSGVKVDIREKNGSNAAAVTAVFDAVSHHQQLQGTAAALNTTEGRSLITNPSIGEMSLGASLSLGSGCHLENASREADRESASNTAMVGASIAGSLAGAGSASESGAEKKSVGGGSSIGMGIGNYHLQCRLEVGADVHAKKKLSLSSERLSETISLSERSATISLAEDGVGSAASTRGLAGSILAYKMGDNQSVGSYRVVTTGESSETTSHHVILSGGATDSDELSMTSLPPVAGPLVKQQLDASVSSKHSTSAGPECGDELNSGHGSSELVEHKGRISKGYRLARQMSENISSCGGSDDATEHVRFNENVSFIDAKGTSSKEDSEALMTPGSEEDRPTVRARGDEVAAKPGSSAVSASRKTCEGT